MMKTKLNRVLAGLLALALLGSLILSLIPRVSAGEETEILYLDTAEDFAALAKNCSLDTWSQGKTVVLRADISLAGAEITSIPIFSGVFDGNGHTISGLKITGSMSPAGLFGILLETAVVQNLTVSAVTVLSDDGCGIGGIAGENYGTVTDCAVTGYVAGGSQVGGIAGINAATGRILRCRAGGSVSGEKMTGGIVGCNLGIVEECRSTAYVNTAGTDPTLRPEDLSIDFSADLSRLSTMDTGTASSDTGGIAGYSSGILSGCVNTAPVGYPHMGYNVGGIAGRSCGFVTGCENSGEIYGRKDVGGIAGQMEPYIVRNITESTLSRLERQLDELDGMLDKALNDANAGVGTVTARLNRIADYMDSAAEAIREIRTSGTVISTVTGSGETDSQGGVTVTPPQIEAGGGGAAAGSGGAVITPGGGAAGGGVVAGGGVQGGLTEGGIEGEHHTSAGGSISASTQISVTTSLNGLSGAICGMTGQLRLLNGEVSGISDTLTQDLKDIQAQIGTISDTVLELFGGDSEGDTVVDSSEIDVDQVTSGKVFACGNGGSVSGDINVGGITGSIAMEYELDPEDDISSDLSGKQRRKLEYKAILQNCVNTGQITAKRSYTGGICGRMDLGLIAGAENYGGVTSESGSYVGGIAGLTASVIRQCFSKCTLSGGKYIGGIVGSGITEAVSGDASTVAGCCSMVRISEYQEFIGAISGENAGNFTENYFISDDLTGMNGRSYTGRAEPIAYEALVSSDEAAVPEAFLRLTLTFTADGETLKTVPFEYGASFDETVYPEIPAKDGCDARWDTETLRELHFDTVVDAVYTPYITALSSAETRGDGRPIFFVEGQFTEADALSVTALPNTPEEFEDLAASRKDFLLKSFSGTKVSREIVEQWRLSIPKDGQTSHTVRYLSPNASPDHLEIYCKEDGVWRKAGAETVGSYLVFSVSGTEAEIAVIRTSDTWWVWLLAGIPVLLLLILLIRLIRKLLRSRKRPSPAASGESDGSEAAEPEDDDWVPPARGTKKRWLTPLLVALALLIGIGGTAAFFLLPDILNGKEAYQLLKRYSEKQELSMELTVEAQADSSDWDLTAAVERTSVNGQRVTAVSQDGRTLYYHNGAVLLENGKAYRIHESFPDYSLLLDQTAELYRHTDITEDGGTYTITAKDADARAILKLLLPAAADTLPDTGTVQVTLLTREDEISELRFTADGSLNDARRTPFHVSAVLRVLSDTVGPLRIPETVRSAILDGETDADEILSQDLIRLVSAWMTLDGADAVGAKLRLQADCGPITLDGSPDYFRWNEAGTAIRSLRENGYALYFTDTAICDSEGKGVTVSDTSGTSADRLYDIAFEACMNGSADCGETDGEYRYTLTLDAAGMKAVACAIAPTAEDMDITYDSGSILVAVRDDRISRIEIRCSGRVRIVVSDADVLFSAVMDFADAPDPGEIPDPVKAALLP